MGRKTAAQKQAEADEAARLAASIPQPPSGVDTNSPEFRQAVSAAVAHLIPDIVAKIAEARPANVPAPDQSSDRNFASSIAMAIAEFTNQGIGKQKPVSPEIIRAREEARDRMFKLLIAAHAEGKVPTYGLRAKVYLDEVLVEPAYIDPSTKAAKQTEISWPQVPNEAMVPLNDVAKEIFKAFQESIGSTAALQRNEPLSITPGGLVIVGKNLARREVSTGKPDGQGLQIHHRGDKGGGTFKEVNILGTVAKPALQTV